MNEWSMIIFIALAGLGAVCYLRKTEKSRRFNLPINLKRARY
jgi:hypothetical protein